jgi:ClpP class serine protease
MGLTERMEIYTKIEAHRKHPIIAYITSKRQGIYASMANDALPSLIDQLDTLPEGTTALDFLIVSLGGDPMVAWRIMSLLRERVGKDGLVNVLVPQSAFSAATLLALGADEIVMHPNGHLGPVDMQVSTVMGDQ